MRDFKASPAEAILVTEKLTPEQVLSAAIDSGCRHICQKDGFSFDEELASANCLVKGADNFLRFPASTILTPANLNAAGEKALMLHEAKFESSVQKIDILNDITNALQSKGVCRTLRDDVIAVADELYTNAVYNAPFVDLHTHKNPGICRHGHVKMSDGKVGRIFLAQFEKRLVIGCLDPYGSLELNAYMKKIRATYQKGEARTINFGAGGAGLGSYIIFNTGSSLYFGVWPGQATMLCCVVPTGLSNRKRGELVKHFHWIQR